MRGRPKTSVLRKCTYCGREFYAFVSAIKRGGGKFCSCACSISNPKPKRGRKGIFKKCLNCGKDFYVLMCYLNRGRGKYCGEKCQHEGLKTGIVKKCLYCDKSFYSTSSRNTKFCSNNCKGKFLIGKTWEDLYGKEKAVIAKLKMSIWQRGEKSRNWKGGRIPLYKRIRDSFKYAQWRTEVFKRDNYTCQCCGKRGGELEAHHNLKRFCEILKENKIDTIEKALNCKELWDIDYGKTLCKKCHKEKHCHNNSLCNRKDSKLKGEQVNV